MSTREIDLTRDDLGVAPHSYAFYELRELRHGESAVIRMNEEPDIMMKSLEIQLRRGIHWEVTEAGPPVWTVSVQRRDDVDAADLVDLLTRDHLRIDKLFAKALHLTNANNVEEAIPYFRQYAEALRRHLGVEDELLVPRFDLPRRPGGDDPTSIMLHEHQQILEQTVMMEELIDSGMGDAGMLAPFFAMLSGQLAKHEYREEENLFPHWKRLMSNMQGEEEKIFQEVREKIGDVR
jgi:uncharacterized protein (DUF2249 family)